MESEKKTEPYLKSEIAKLGGMSFKFTCPNIKGVPDQICVFPTGQVIFVEVKSEGEEPENHQTRMHNNMRRRGAIVYVVDTKKKVDVLINKYKKETECQVAEIKLQ